MDAEALLQRPESERDDRWELEFLDAVPGLTVEVQAEGQPVEGPDGWPYLSVRTGRGDEPLAKIIRWLAGRGIGLVVNAHKMAPDYVFTFGMLWNFIETGRFMVPQDLRPASGTEVKMADRPLRGPPSDAYLPPYVRALIAEFLRDQGIKEPKILVASSADYKEADLVFSLESLGPLDSKDQKTLAEALTWFLPLHYSLIFARERDLSGWVKL